MKISEISSLDDIREYEKTSNLRDDIQALISPLKIEAGSDEEMLSIIQLLKSKWLGFKEGPFVSEQQEYIFYLTKLEGKQRNKALGITDAHYEDKNLANKWKNAIAHKVARDKGGCDQAMTILLKIYDALVDDFEADDV